MQIIRKNPNHIIPNITERDIDSKIFVASVMTSDGGYIGYLIKNMNLPHENIIECCGGLNSYDGRNVWWFNVPSLIRALIRLWNITDQTTCYVLESRSDFDNIRHEIKNLDVMNKIELEVNRKFGGII